MDGVCKKQGIGFSHVRIFFFDERFLGNAQPIRKIELHYIITTETPVQIETPNEISAYATAISQSVKLDEAQIVESSGQATQKTILELLIRDLM